MPVIKDCRMMLKNAILVVALTAAFWLAAGCGKDSQADAKPAGPPAFPVKVITAEARLVPFSTDYLATLKSRSSSVLQPQVEGDIIKVFVRSGQRVEAGTPILQIDPRKQEATLNNQEAAHQSKLATMEQNRIDLERKKKLYAAGVISKSDLDTAQSAYNVSKADVDALEASIREQSVQLRYYTVKAPAAGTVGDIPVRVGDRVTTQTVLTTLDRGSELEAYVYVPSEKSSQVHMGMPVDLLDDSGKTVARTRIFFISPRVDTDSQTLLVKTAVPNPEGKFRNDQQVHSRVVWSEQKKPVIPLTAVTRMSGKMFAFVAEGQGSQTVARQRVIEVGDMAGNDYVVLEGIQPGDKVIVTGVQMLADGMPVIPQAASSN
jgi:RND family efflux transporter MFP subunit